MPAVLCSDMIVFNSLNFGDLTVSYFFFYCRPCSSSISLNQRKEITYHWLPFLLLFTSQYNEMCVFLNGYANWDVCMSCFLTCLLPSVWPFSPSWLVPTVQRKSFWCSAGVNLSVEVIFMGNFCSLVTADWSSHDHNSIPFYSRGLESQIP